MLEERTEAGSGVGESVEGGGLEMGASEAEMGESLRWTRA